MGETRTKRYESQPPPTPVPRRRDRAGVFTQDDVGGPDPTGPTHNSDWTRDTAATPTYLVSERWGRWYLMPRERGQWVLELDTRVELEFALEALSRGMLSTPLEQPTLYEAIGPHRHGPCFRVRG